MLVIQFGGWFQCRLATDPDPYDEPRGVSGYVHAYAGEPDLDRLIHWQKPAFTRTLAPDVGVTVQRVVIDGRPMQDTPLLGAPVTLNGNPKFEGRNGVIAEDGFEPVYPIDLEIAAANIRLRRSFVPFDPDYPYEGLNAPGVDTDGADEISQVTGIDSLAAVWQARLQQLTALTDLAEPQKTAVAERIQFLQDSLSRGGGAARFFGARMNFQVDLNSPAPAVDGVEDAFDYVAEVSDEWRVRFWLGGWDADVLCGFCRGQLTVPRFAGAALPKAQPLPAGINRNRV